MCELPRSLVVPPGQKNSVDSQPRSRRHADSTRLPSGACDSAHVSQIPGHNLQASCLSNHPTPKPPTLPTAATSALSGSLTRTLSRILAPEPVEQEAGDSFRLPATRHVQALRKRKLVPVPEERKYSCHFLPKMGLSERSKHSYVQTSQAVI